MKAAGSGWFAAAAAIHPARWLAGDSELPAAFSRKQPGPKIIYLFISVRLKPENGACVTPPELNDLVNEDRGGDPKEPRRDKNRAGLFSL